MAAPEVVSDSAFPVPASEAEAATALTRLGSIIILANHCDFTSFFCVVVSIYSVDSAVAAAPEVQVSDSAFPVSVSEAEAATALTRLGSIIIFANPFRLFLQPPRHCV